MSNTEVVLNRPFDDLLNYISSFILHYLSNSARVGHRNRLNIFDVVKVMNALNITPSDLKNYIKWSNCKEATTLLNGLFPSMPFEDISSRECKLDLTFGVDVNESKRPGFEYFPPTPSSFTFKFTPVTLHFFPSFYIISLPFFFRYSVRGKKKLYPFLKGKQKRN